MFLSPALGLPFCGSFSGSPVHGCATIGLAHSRNLLPNPSETSIAVQDHRIRAISSIGSRESTSCNSSLIR